MTRKTGVDLPEASAEPLQDVDHLVNEILTAFSNSPEKKRLLVGIAGAPASGKSTLAERVVVQLNAALVAGDDASVVVPMDGYHLDNNILETRGLREVKGAPHTFDAAGFEHLLQRLAEPLMSCDAEEHTDFGALIYIPLFDRAMDLARCAGSFVAPHHRIVVVEGNYLLLDRPIWRNLQHSMDLTVSLDVPMSVLEERLIKRWVDHGHSHEAAKAKALTNDIPNARVVVQESTQAHFVLAA